tara:strand:- start:495 stop:782 length:288 start_codon:yes stop_codon:yes gene_type:complete
MSDLSFHVREFLPDCQGEELELRKSLLVARSYAADLRGKVWSRTALEHAADAHQLAEAIVFAEVPADRLKIALAYCRNLVHAAFLADHLEEGIAQ